jgi:hypothetical protein
MKTVELWFWGILTVMTFSSGLYDLYTGYYGWGIFHLSASVIDVFIFICRLRQYRCQKRFRLYYRKMMQRILLDGKKKIDVSKYLDLSNWIDDRYVIKGEIDMDEYIQYKFQLIMAVQLITTKEAVASIINIMNEESQRKVNYIMSKI